MIFNILMSSQGLRNDYEIANLRTRRDKSALLSNIIRLSQIHNASRWRAFAACAAILLRKKRLGSRTSCGCSGDDTTSSRCMRAGQGHAGEERAEGFGSDRAHFHSSPPRSPTPAEGTKKTWESMKLSHVDGMNKAGALRRAAPYFSRSQAALMRCIASTMFSSLVA